MIYCCGPNILNGMMALFYKVATVWQIIKTVKDEGKVKP